jgi:hypothetical protein
LINTLKDKILTYFKEQSTISKDKLVEYIIVDFPELKKSTINVYLSRLKKEGIIKNPSRGVYSLENKEVFSPEIDTSLIRLYNKIQKQYPYIIFCVWNTKWINDLMRHQPFKQYQIIEVEKDAVEQVFNKLNESIKNVFLNPDAEIFERYIHNVNEAIIIKPLVSESPLDKVHKITIPSLEKLLVDMLIDIDVFAAQQGEIEFIYGTAFKKFQINRNKMKRYAIRRNREERVKKLINITLAEV